MHGNMNVKFLVLISVTGRVDSKDITAAGRKTPMTPSGIESACSSVPQLTTPLPAPSKTDKCPFLLHLLQTNAFLGFILILSYT